MDVHLLPPSLLLSYPSHPASVSMVRGVLPSCSPPIFLPNLAPPRPARRLRHLPPALAGGDGRGALAVAQHGAAPTARGAWWTASEYDKSECHIKVSTEVSQTDRKVPDRQKEVECPVSCVDECDHGMTPRRSPASPTQWDRMEGARVDEGRCVLLLGHG